MNELPEHIKALIAYIDVSMPVDGPMKVVVLRTVASYYESLTIAETQLHLMQKSIELLN